MQPHRSGLGNAWRPPCSGSRARHDSIPVTVPVALRGPRATRRAAAQWRYRHLDLVTSLETLAGPALARQGAWCCAFEIPDGDAAIWCLDLQHDERVRAGVFELLHDAFEFDLIVLIEHCEGMVRHRGPANCAQRADDQKNSK